MKTNAMQPLLNPCEKEILQAAVEALPDDGIIVEWGSGGSTVFWLEHMTPGQHLISIEHNPQWAKTVQDALKAHPKRDQVTYYFKEPKAPLDFYGYGVPFEENPVGLEDYIDPMDARLYRAHLYFIDGIARGPIAASVLSYMSNDAVVFIHDYAGREIWYDWACNLYFTQEQVGKTLIQLKDHTVRHRDPLDDYASKLIAAK